jgi:membrane-associated phospholipid phosphatase
MRPNAVALLTVLALGAAPPLGAQQTFPYQLTPGREGVLLAGGAVLLGAGFAINAELDVLTAEDIAALDPADINSFDRPATTKWSVPSSNVSDAVLVATVGASLTTIAFARGPSAPVTVGVMLGETLLIGNGVSQLMKTAIRRIRPYAYNNDPDIPFDKKTTKTARQSFPSGHSINAFASAVFLSTVFAKLQPTSPARPWIWGGSLAAATTVGLLRYQAGKHFPTDVLAGAAIGGVLGWGIPKMHESDRVRVSVAPALEGSMISLSISY